MAEKRELTCCYCHKKFPREEIIFYGSSKNQMKYCPDCYKDKIEREKFYQYICELFGIRAPGPKIYAQRRKIKENYGFTDETIMKTLDYLFKVKKMDKGFESIGLVNPKTVDEAKDYYESKKVVVVNENKVEKIIVPTNDNKKKKDLIDLDDLSLEELEG